MVFVKYSDQDQEYNANKKHHCSNNHCQDKKIQKLSRNHHKEEKVKDHRNTVINDDCFNEMNKDCTKVHLSGGDDHSRIFDQLRKDKHKVYQPNCARFHQKKLECSDFSSHESREDEHYGREMDTFQPSSLPVSDTQYFEHQFQQHYQEQQHEQQQRINNQKTALLTLLRQLKDTEEAFLHSQQLFQAEKQSLQQNISVQEKRLAEATAQLLDERKQCQHQLTEERKRGERYQKGMKKVLAQLDKFALGCKEYGLVSGSVSVEKMGDALKIQVGEWAQCFDVEVHDGEVYKTGSASTKDGKDFCEFDLNRSSTSTRFSCSMETIQSLHLEIKKLKMKNVTLMKRIGMDCRKRNECAISHTGSSYDSCHSSTLTDIEKLKIGVTTNKIEWKDHSECGNYINDSMNEVSKNDRRVVLGKSVSDTLVSRPTGSNTNAPELDASKVSHLSGLTKSSTEMLIEAMSVFLNDFEIKKQMQMSEPTARAGDEGKNIDYVNETSGKKPCRSSLYDIHQSSFSTKVTAPQCLKYSSIISAAQRLSKGSTTPFSGALSPST